MCRHPDASSCYISEYRVEPATVRAILDRVDPAQDAFKIEQLVAHLVGRIVALHHALGGYVQLAECSE
jgi:hypothetical protein